MALPIRRRDEQIDHALSQQLLPGKTERALGRRVELHNLILGIDRDDAIERRRKDGGLARFALHDGLFRPLPLRDVAEVPDAAEQFPLRTPQRAAIPVERPSVGQRDLLVAG